MSFFLLPYLATEVLETALVQFHVISLHLFFLFILLCLAGSMWDLSSLTRDGTCAPCSESMES